MGLELRPGGLVGEWLCCPILGCVQIAGYPDTRLLSAPPPPYLPGHSLCPEERWSSTSRPASSSVTLLSQGICGPHDCEHSEHCSAAGVQGEGMWSWGCGLGAGAERLCESTRCPHQLPWLSACPCGRTQCPALSGGVPRLIIAGRMTKGQTVMGPQVGQQ